MAFNPFDDWMQRWMAQPLTVDVLPVAFARDVEVRLEHSQEAFLDWLTEQDQRGEGRALYRKVR
ncbi:MAG: hypothetical protein AB7P76_07915 [Candidatus Melainabacteria bacterium]